MSEKDLSVVPYPSPLKHIALNPCCFKTIMSFMEDVIINSLPLWGSWNIPPTSLTFQFPPHFLLLSGDKGRYIFKFPEGALYIKMGFAPVLLAKKTSSL